MNTSIWGEPAAGSKSKKKEAPASSGWDEPVDSNDATTDPTADSTGWGDVVSEQKGNSSWAEQMD